MEKKSESSGYGDIAAILGGGLVGEKVPRTEKYSFEGRMTGSVCEFDLEIDSGSVLGSSKKKSGFVVFSTDGKTADYVEVSNSKLESPATVKKVLDYAPGKGTVGLVG